jgi:hypothetical protein
MQELIEYLFKCLNPKDITEFVIIDSFDINIFNNIVHDGIMICKNKPNTKSNIEFIQIR